MKTPGFGLWSAAVIACLVIVGGETFSPRALYADQVFNIGRLRYGGGGDWYANPSSLPNLLRELRLRLRMRTARREVTVLPSDDRLFSAPIIHMTGHGNVRFSEDERRRLRAYFAAGGFLWADDNYGMDESFRREMAALYPDSPLVELPFDHPIYHSVYSFPDGLPKVHEHAGGPPRGYGIIRDGRLVVFYSFNTDIGNGIEDPDVHDNTPEIREAAMRMAINIVVYALSS